MTRLGVRSNAIKARSIVSGIFNFKTSKDLDYVIFTPVNKDSDLSEFKIPYDVFNMMILSMDKKYSNNIVHELFRNTVNNKGKNKNLLKFDFKLNFLYDNNDKPMTAEILSISAVIDNLSFYHISISPLYLQITNASVSRDKATGRNIRYLILNMSKKVSDNIIAKRLKMIVDATRFGNSINWKFKNLVIEANSLYIADMVIRIMNRNMIDSEAYKEMYVNSYSIDYMSNFENSVLRKIINSSAILITKDEMSILSSMSMFMSKRVEDIIYRRFTIDANSFIRMESAITFCNMNYGPTALVSNFISRKDSRLIAE